MLLRFVAFATVVFATVVYAPLKQNCTSYKARM